MNAGGDGLVEDAVTPEPAPPYPFWGYEDVAMFVGMILPAVALSVLLIAAGAAVDPGFFRQPVIQNLGGQLLTYVLLFGGLAQLFRVKYGQPLFASLAWVLSFSRALWPMLAGPPLALSIGLLGAALHAPLIRNPFEALMQRPWEVALVGIFAVLFGPLAEELAFRGFLLPLLTRSAGATVAVTGTALAFALLHGPQYSWSWQHILLVGSAGVAGTGCAARGS